MGHVFCFSNGVSEKAATPIFHLGVDNGVVKDIVGGHPIINHGATIMGNSIKLRPGFLEVGVLDLVKNLWDIGEFTIDIKINISSITTLAYLFGSSKYGDNNSPGLIYLVPAGNITVKSSSQWSGGLYSPDKINFGEVSRITLSAKNRVLSLYLNDALQGTCPMEGHVANYPVLVGERWNSSATAGSGYIPDALLEFVKIYNVSIK